MALSRPLLARAFFTGVLNNYLSTVAVPRPTKQEVERVVFNMVDKPELTSSRTSGPLAEDTEMLQKATNTLTGLTMFQVSNRPLHPFHRRIEKARGGINRSSRDSGVFQRVLNSTLTWLNDRAGETPIIATCNNLHQLPPEIPRTGRWDATFFIDVPTRAQRLELINQGCNAYQLNELIPSKQKGAIVERMKRWTGTELLKLLETARRLLLLHNGTGISERAMMAEHVVTEAFTYIKPLVETDPGFKQSRARNSVIGVQLTTFPSKNRLFRSHALQNDPFCRHSESWQSLPIVVISTTCAKKRLMLTVTSI